MKTNFLFSVIVALAVASPLSTVSANLGELMSEAGTGWLLGDWVDEDSGGEQVQLKYAWKFKGQVIATSFVSGDGTKAEGMIVRKPGSDEALHFGANSKGAISKGTWEEKDGKAVLNLKHTKEDGEAIEMRIVHEKVDDQAMRVAFIDESGNEQGSVRLVRRKKKE